MPSLADSLVSSSARVLPLRMRPDLTAKTQRYQGQIYWVLKEPVGLHYFRFQEEEYAILQMLDGKTSLDQIKERFEDRFPPQKITVEELGQFVGMLHRSGLVIADVPGQGVQLKKRRDQAKRKELLSQVTNILSLRFKGIDPDRILSWLHPWLKFMYSRTTVVCCMAFALSALILVLSHFDEFHHKLPTFRQFFTGSNWIWLGMSLAVTKVIHEFGHGLTCKHYGGECHEMGVMLLVLTPCLYCNVSDSWMLPNKWHRAYIGAAGMYIELVIASFCTYLWWFSTPGLLNQICLSTMFVCSVSTVIFNANPLLRYDGYYILSDLSEIPNLRQKATDILSRKLSSWCLGLKETEDPFLPQRNQMFFALYSVAAAVYRVFVLFSILWFMYKILEPYKLKVLSQMLAMASIGGMFGQPLWKLWKFFTVPGRIDQVDRKRFRTTLVVVGALLLFIFAVPLPYRVICSLEVKPRGAEPVYVEVPGNLENVTVKAGQHVDAQDVLARLSNLDVKLQIADLEGKREQFKSKLDGLYHSTYSEEAGARAEIPQVTKSLSAIEDQLKQKKKDLEHLTLHAPKPGWIMPAPDTPDRPDQAGQLPNWSGSPLERKNLGAHLQDGVLFCQIGDPKKLEAVLVVEQDDIEFLREHDSVVIKLQEVPNRTYSSEITEISLSEMKVTPRELQQNSGGDVVTKTEEGARDRPMNTSYQARAPLDDEDGVLRLGLRGQAKIHASRWQTLGHRAWRYLARTFNFKL